MDLQLETVNTSATIVDITSLVGAEVIGNNVALVVKNSRIRISISAAPKREIKTKKLSHSLPVKSVSEPRNCITFRRKQAHSQEELDYLKKILSA